MPFEKTVHSDPLSSTDAVRVLLTRFGELNQKLNLMGNALSSLQQHLQNMGQLAGRVTSSFMILAGIPRAFSSDVQHWLGHTRGVMRAAGVGGLGGASSHGLRRVYSSMGGKGGGGAGGSGYDDYRRKKEEDRRRDIEHLLIMGTMREQQNTRDMDRKKAIRDQEKIYRDQLTKYFADSDKRRLDKQKADEEYKARKSRADAGFIGRKESYYKAKRQEEETDKFNRRQEAKDKLRQSLKVGLLKDSMFRSLSGKPARTETELRDMAKQGNWAQHLSPAQIDDILGLGPPVGLSRQKRQALLPAYPMRGVVNYPHVPGGTGPGYPAPGTPSPPGAGAPSPTPGKASYSGVRPPHISEVLELLKRQHQALGTTQKLSLFRSNSRARGIPTHIGHMRASLGDAIKDIEESGPSDSPARRLLRKRAEKTANKYRPHFKGTESRNWKDIFDTSKMTTGSFLGDINELFNQVRGKTKHKHLWKALSSRIGNPSLGGGIEGRGSPLLDWEATSRQKLTRDERLKRLFMKRTLPRAMQAVGGAWQKGQDVTGRAAMPFLVGSSAAAGALHAASPDAFATVTGSFKLLSAAIGGMLIPQAMRLAGWFQGLADRVENISEPMKNAIGNIVLWGGVLLGSVLVINKVMTAFGILVPAIISVAGFLVRLAATAGLSGIGKAIGVAALVAPVADIGNEYSRGAMRSLENDPVTDEDRQIAVGQMQDRSGTGRTLSPKEALAASQKREQELMEKSESGRGLWANTKHAVSGFGYIFNDDVEERRKADKLRFDEARGRKALQEFDSNPGSMQGIKAKQSALQPALFAMNALKTQPSYSGIEDMYKKIQIDSLSKDPLTQKLDELARQYLVKMLENLDSVDKGISEMAQGVRKLYGM